MGIIKAISSAVGGALADQWLEVIEPDRMSDTTVFARGVSVRKNDARNAGGKGTVDTVSNGSVIHVYPNQFMMMVDGGKVVDYTAEEGYYTVNNSSLPSLFNGELEQTVMESFNRVRFAGTSPRSQKVYYINLQEIKGIKFGTRNPINYFDNFYNAELFLRAHGSYSLKIKDPILFYAEAVPRDRDRVDINDMNEQYLSEFLEALQSAINQMSADGVRVSYVTSKGRELGQYMSTILDEQWRQMRGMEIQSVGIASISYDEDSIKLINLRNQGAMLGDPAVREGFVQGAVARGMEAAGSNAAGAMHGFVGMGVGMQGGGGFVAAASQANRDQAQAQAPQAAPADSWQCACGHVASGKFCSECGQPRPSAGREGEWKCPACGRMASGKFCSECGAKRPEPMKCPQCGYVPEGEERPKFCPECGARFPEV